MNPNYTEIQILEDMQHEPCVQGMTLAQCVRMARLIHIAHQVGQLDGSKNTLAKVEHFVHPNNEHAFKKISQEVLSGG